jgi:hypothetical protein
VTDGQSRPEGGGDSEAKTAESEEEDAIPDFIFETSRCNICNIRPKVYETLATYV